MTKRLRIQVPEPCHERWDHMSPTEKGAYCQSCSKEVMDFTGLSDADVAYYFQHNKGKSCGRFRNDQLGRAISMPPEPKQKRYWLNALWLAPLALLGKTAYGQSTTTDYILLDKPPRCLRVDTAAKIQLDTLRLEQVPLEHKEYSLTIGQTIVSHTFESGIADSVSVKKFNRISGRVINAQTKAALPLAIIRLNDDLEVRSDSSGIFSFDLPPGLNADSIKISLEGFSGKFIGPHSIGANLGDIELSPLFVYEWKTPADSGFTVDFSNIVFTDTYGYTVAVLGDFNVSEGSEGCLGPRPVPEYNLVINCDFLPVDTTPDHETQLQGLHSTIFPKPLPGMNTPQPFEKELPEQPQAPKQNDRNGVLPASNNNRRKRS